MVRVGFNSNGPNTMRVCLEGGFKILVKIPCFGDPLPGLSLARLKNKDFTVLLCRDDQIFVLWADGLPRGIPFSGPQAPCRRV